MKTLLSSFLILAYCLFISACKKADTNPMSVTCHPVPTDADGVLTATIYTSMPDSSGLDSVVNTGAEAWFLNCGQTANAGNVFCNGQWLVTVGAMNFHFHNYTNWIWNPNLTDSGYIHWIVEGDTSNNLPAVDYFTSDTFPALGNFSVPDSIYLGTDLLIKFQASNPFEYGTCVIRGSGPNYNSFGQFTQSFDVGTDSISIKGSSLLFLSGAKYLSFSLTVTKLDRQIVSNRVFYFAKTNTYGGKIVIRD